LNDDGDVYDAIGKLTNLVVYVKSIFFFG